MSNTYQDRPADKAQDRARIATAYWCCKECGEYWGEAPKTLVLETVHQGKCDVCLADGVTVYPVRFWWYLRKRVEEEA